MAAEVGALRVAVGADISGLVEGMGRAQQVVSSGVATMSKSAKASARIFEQGRVSAEQLLSAVDPLFAAQLRYDKELARAEQLMKSGTLTAAEFAKVQTGLKTQLDASSGAMGGLHKGMGMARIGQMEMAHAVRSTTDMLIMGQKPLTAFSLEAGRVFQSIGYLSGGTSKFATFMSGSWGAAVVAGVTALGLLIPKLFGARDGVEGLVDKMKKQASEAERQEEANQIWAKSIEGVIEAQKKLNKELDDSLKVEELVGYQQLAQSRTDLQDLERGVAGLQQQLKSAKGELKNAQALPAFGGDAAENAALASARASAISAAQDKIDGLNRRIGIARKAIEDTQKGIADAQFKIGRQVGEEAADQAKAFDTTIESQRALIENNKNLAGSANQLEAALALLKKAGDAAAGAGVPTDKAAKNLMQLVAGLNSGKSAPAAFAAQVEKMAKALQSAADAAKELNKHNIDPKVQFKQSVIGAEGTGQNPASSALGFGQFIRTTWISYFDRLFPDKATLTDDAKLAFRNVRTVAEAIIDKATEDYSKVLKSAGQQITAASLYTVHMLSAGDPKGRVALRLLQAPADASARSIVGSRVVAGNGTIFTGTVGQARAEIARRIGDSSGAVSSGAAAIEQALAKGLEDEAKKRQRFFDDEQQTFAQIIEARKEQGLSAADVAKVEHEAVEQSRQKLEADILAKQAAGDYTKDEADLRISLNNELAKLRDQAVERRMAQAQYAERERQIENASRVVSGMVSSQEELLKAREGLVTTAKGRRAIEERLLDLQYDEEKRQLQAQIEEAARLRALADRTKSAQDLAAAERAEADAKVAQARLDTLPERRSLAQQQNAQANASPLEQWARSVPHTADEINAALQSIEVKGIDGLTDAITGVITGTESLKSAFHNLAASILADLIQMTIKMMLFRALSAAFGGGGVAPGSFSGGTAGMLSGGPASSGLFSTIPHFARGGGFTVKGMTGTDRNVLSMNGLPIAKVSYGERINIANDDGAGFAGPNVTHQHFDLRGAVMTEDLLRQMDEKAARAADAGARMGVDRLLDMNSRSFGKVLRQS